METPAPSRGPFILLAGIGVLGLGFYVWLLARAWVGTDQMNLLALGESFARTGVLDPVAKGMSGGGRIPGSLLQLLVGLPLMVWRDYRSPLILIGILNVLAGIVLYRVVRRELPPITLLLYVTIYWLSPWRLIHAAMLWEPAYLFLPAAVHFWATTKLSKQKNALASLALGAVLLVTPQLHGSFLFLWILTALLIWRSELQVRWVWLAAGAFLGALTLIPMVVAAMTASVPSSLPREGFIGLGFLLVYPVLKGLLYWIRLPTLDLQIREVMWLQHGWATSTMDWIVVIALRIVQALETLSIGLGALAMWWYVQRLRTKQIAFQDMSWFERYAGYSVVSLLCCSGLSPVTLQNWHVLIALHAAALYLAIWSARQFELRPHAWRYFAGYVSLAIVIVGIVGFGKSIFQKTELPREVVTMPEVGKLLPTGLPIEQ